MVGSKRTKSHFNSRAARLNHFLRRGTFHKKLCTMNSIAHYHKRAENENTLQVGIGYALSVHLPCETIKEQISVLKIMTKVQERGDHPFTVIKIGDGDNFSPASSLYLACTNCGDW